MKTTGTFDKMVDALSRRPRYISSCGSTRSGKTYSVLQLFILLAQNDRKPTVNSIVSETFPHLRKGAIREFQSIMEDEGLWSPDSWSKTESTYTFDNGAIIEFFSVDNASKVHGPARDRLFINECQFIPYNTARQLFVRTRGLIILDYNPVQSFWANEDIERRDNCVRVHSTYRDNTFLTPEQVEEIESNKGDTNWWRVYGEGKIGQLAGLIYSIEIVDAMPEPAGLAEIYGLDFGFTNDPTAIVHILADTRRKILYIDEVCYRTRMLNGDIIRAMDEAGVPRRSVPIYADCAEPKSIAEISQAGYNVKPCDKGAATRSDKLKFQIQYMQGWTIKVTKNSVNVIREARNYTWMKDKDGKDLPYPVDVWNHAMDAMRYAAYTHLASGRGTYKVG